MVRHFTRLAQVNYGIDTGFYPLGSCSMKHNPKVAERFANRLVDLAESLRSTPERGRPVKNWPGVRVIVLAPYLIFYHFGKTANRVEVLRFWHGARDPATLDM